MTTLECPAVGDGGSSGGWAVVAVVREAVASRRGCRRRRRCCVAIPPPGPWCCPRAVGEAVPALGQLLVGSLPPLGWRHQRGGEEGGGRRRPRARPRGRGRGRRRMARPAPGCSGRLSPARDTERLQRRRKMLGLELLVKSGRPVLGLRSPVESVHDRNDRRLGGCTIPLAKCTRSEGRLPGFCGKSSVPAAALL